MRIARILLIARGMYLLSISEEDRPGLKGVCDEGRGFE